MKNICKNKTKERKNKRTKEPKIITKRENMMYWTWKPSPSPLLSLSSIYSIPPSHTINVMMKKTRCKQNLNKKQAWKTSYPKWLLHDPRTADEQSLQKQKTKKINWPMLSTAYRRWIEKWKHQEKKLQYDDIINIYIYIL